jgi:hypothetical protein
MADKAFVLVKEVLRAEQAVLVFKFRMTLPATVFIPPVLLAPEPTLFTLRRVAEEAGLLGILMRVTGYRLDGIRMCAI